MEISPALKKLYKHWEFHTLTPPLNSKRLRLNLSIKKAMIQFASERMRIWERKTEGNFLPYTKDQILASCRFCNVYRELDRQTIEFHTQLLPLISNFSLWLLNMLYCRLVCNPRTVKHTGLLSFDPRHNHDVRKKLEDLPRPKYGTAYVFPISVIQNSQFPTRELFFCEYLPIHIHELANIIEKFNRAGVSKILPQLLQKFEFNFRFLWTEVLIDIAYQYPKYIDLFKKFPVGPGSAPTVFQLHNSAPPEEIILEMVKSGLKLSFPYLTYNGNPIFLSAENWEGVACEFRKYTNLRSGHGRKRLYR